jgi:hypothetical protein
MEDFLSGLVFGVLVATILSFVSFCEYRRTLERIGDRCGCEQLGAGFYRIIPARLAEDWEWAYELLYRRNDVSNN